MRRIWLHDHAHCSPTHRASLEMLVQRHQTLADVLAWTRSVDPPAKVVDVVTQDEYTHDVVVEAPGQPYLAFDTT